MLGLGFDSAVDHAGPQHRESRRFGRDRHIERQVGGGHL